MIKNYLKVAIRNFSRKKGYSIINVAGLSVGMSVAMLIGTWIYDELSYNRCHDNYDRIAQVCQHQSINGEINTSFSVPMPLGAELKTTYSNDFKHVAMVWWPSDHILSLDENKIMQYGTFMSAEVLEMFSFKMVKGDWKALQDPASVILSESTAKAIFGNDDPLNKMIRIDNALDVKVTGVYQEFPYNSRFHSIRFVSSWDFWVSSNNWLKADEHNWSNNGYNIFVEVYPNAVFEKISEKVSDIKSRMLNKETAINENAQLFLYPMRKWHLYSNWYQGKEVGGRIQFVKLFGIIGVFVLLLACINFMNLSTSRSEKRAKEVGVRKAIGSARSQLIYQFLSESFFVVMLAFVVANLIVVASLSWFNELADKQMEILWGSPYFWLISLACVLVTCLLAGSYPALYLSSFEPVKVLKGTFNVGRFASVPRKVLVVFQFTISISLVIGTITVYRQIQYAKDRPIGYNKEGLVMVRRSASDFSGKFDILKTGLIASGAVADIAESSSPVTEMWYTNTGFSWKGKDPNMREDFTTVAVTHEYGKTMGWKFLQGRDFSRDHSTDSSAIILNETAAKFMKLKDPLGEEIIWNGKKFTVIGVINDVIMGSPYTRTKQTIFFLNYDQSNWINIRLNPAMTVQEALSRIEKVFQTLVPAVPFDYKFIDQEYALKFSGEERLGKLASLFTGLAIFISCLGLLGLASFMAEKRTREIGIRKVLGASVFNLWTMLSKEFLILIIASCAISIPLSYYFMHNWLLSYDYHTSMSAWVFLWASIGALIVTLFTVSFQTLKASIANPVKSLALE